MKASHVTVLGALVLLAAPLAHAADGEGTEWLEVKGNRIKFYGFARLDVAYSDSAVAPNNQYTMWAASEDPSLGGSNDEVLDIYSRLSRFGVSFERDTIPRLETARLNGKIEIDFQNGGSESRNAPRMRHAYLEVVDSRGWKLLAGQTWDLISPLYPAVNGDGMMWNSGNTGDRRPQLRFTWSGDLGEGQGYDLALAAARMGAITNRDLDNNGVGDGTDSGSPMLQARVGVRGLLGGRVNAGVWGHLGWEEADAGAGIGTSGETDFRSSSVGIDLQAKLAEKLTLKAEAFTGMNLDDIRAGVGQGINTTTGDEIDSKGGWVELGYQCADWTQTAVGAMLDDPKDGDVAGITGGRGRDMAFYLGQVFDFGGGFNAGLELIHWDTEYTGGLRDGDANRVNLWFRYSF